MNEEISYYNALLASGLRIITKFIEFSKVTTHTIDFVECSEMPVGLPKEKIGGECFAPLARSYLLCAGAR